MDEARFEELRFYRAAMRLLKAAYRLAEQLPKYEKYNLASQLRRAALSTVLNIAEGYGRYHFLDKLRFFYYARGSLFETLSGFIAARAVGHVDDEQLAWARQTTDEACASLNAYINYIRNQKQGAQTFGEKHIQEPISAYEIAGQASSEFPNSLIPNSQPQGDNMNEKRKLAVVAIGGNSLILDKQHEDVTSQMYAVQETCKHIADMIERGWNLVITHGNGPQVGFILRRNELAAHEVHTTPLDLIGADTQGSIGYMIAQALSNEFKRRGIDRPIASVVTQVLVDRDDPAFQNPSKGIGGFTTENDARKFEDDGWRVVEDAGRGWRRVIASPIPLKIVELEAIRTLVEQGFIVIAVGGGGIPVIEDENGNLVGTRAVIDKDRATSLLARELEVDLFLVSTAVSQVAINFNEPDQQWLGEMTADEARKYQAEGHFKPGSMGPKIEAVLSFLDAYPAGKALITDPPNIANALDGKSGTWIVC